MQLKQNVQLRIKHKHNHTNYKGEKSMEDHIVLLTQNNI